MPVLCNGRQQANHPRGSADVLADEYDLVVQGAGAGGMTAALVGAIEGMRVLLIEKSPQVGGTSSRSAGTLWIPGNPLMADAGARTQDVNEARIYLDALVGERSPAPLREDFLQSGPEMLRYLRQRTEIRFKPCPKHADYHPELPGSRPGAPGRVRCTRRAWAHATCVTGCRIGAAPA